MLTHDDGAHKISVSGSSAAQQTDQGTVFP
jgi:hypothetical protein